MKKTFFSNGKLLLTGEYIVLDGAKALALPTRYGQYLDIANGAKDTIHWQSFDADGSIWLDEQILLSAIFENKQDNKSAEVNTLVKILHEAWLVNPEPLTDAEGFLAITKLTFPRLWGLGTSSTLINNIAQWFSIDAFNLLAKSFGGSGYDIACAQNDTPILFHLEDGEPIVEPVAAFNPPFSDNLYFVYLNRKQSSREAIENYKRRRKIVPLLHARIDELTQQILHAKSVEEFSSLLQEHENIMSEILGLPAIKILAFPDYPGTIKSLGAWGGDFILATANENPQAYFKSKGFETIIPYKEMILDIGIDFSEGLF